MLYVTIIAAVVLMLVGYGVLAFNRLIHHRNACQQAFADIEAALKRRHDLIPNLVDTVKGYASHERGVFESVASARAGAVGASGPAAAARAETGLMAALGQLFAVAENYPDLKASQNFIDLQHKLSATEDTIQEARRAYNAMVRDMNTMVQTFPSKLIARLTHIPKAEYFEIEDRPEREPVSVAFS